MALTIDGSDPTGDLGDLLDAKLPIAGGKILQVVRATDSTDRTTTSITFVDASISVTITPQKSDSAILIIWCVSMFKAAASEYVAGRITDNSNNAISGAETSFMGSANATNQQALQTLIAYATPATLSATTYKARFRGANGNTVTLNNSVNTGQLYAIEVSA